MNFRPSHRAEAAGLVGPEVLAVLASFGFIQVSQKGSHVKVQRLVEGSQRQTLTVPLHQVLDRGTLQAIFRQALRFIPDSELRRFFRHD